MKTNIFLLALFLLVCIPSVGAASNGTQDVVKVGVYVLNVGKFDVSSGSYTVDFYLNLQCDAECHPDNFEFINGRATANDKLIDEPALKFYRIQATLSENIDLKNYPFDEHYLPITLEDKRNTKEQLVYQVDESQSGVDPAVTLVGWDLIGWNAQTRDHVYVPYDETYSSYTFNVGIKRIYLASLLKTFLPIVFILIAGLLALLIEERDKLWTRIGINTSTLIATVMFHLNVTSTIPPVGYLTFADKFMIIAYIGLVLSLLSSILMMVHAKKGDEKLEKKIHLTAVIGIPLFMVIGYLFLFLNI